MKKEDVGTIDRTECELITRTLLSRFPHYPFANEAWIAETYQKCLEDEIDRWRKPDINASAKTIASPETIQ